MLHGNALRLGESVGLLAEDLRELLTMVWEIDVTNLLSIEVGIDAPIVAEESGLAAKAKPVESGQDEVDEGAKTC
jgi:hypothetical protein